MHRTTYLVARNGGGTPTRHVRGIRDCAFARAVGLTHNVLERFEYFDLLAIPLVESSEIGQHDVANLVGILSKAHANVARVRQARDREVEVELRELPIERLHQ